MTIFWCWLSLIEYSSCDNHGCDWSLVFHWQAQRGQAPPTEVMNDYKNPLHLDVVDRYLRRMGDKTIPDEALPSLESFYPP